MKITYKKQTCTRCGGTGEFSYNQMEGTRCRGCRGSGKTLTRNASKSAKAVKVYIDENYSRPVDQVKIGDQIFTGRGYFRVDKITHTPGCKNSEEYINFCQENFCFGYPVGSHIVVRPTVEQFRTKVVSYAQQLKDVVIIKEE